MRAPNIAPKTQEYFVKSNPVVFVIGLVATRVSPSSPVGLHSK